MTLLENHKDLKKQVNELKKYDYDFENLVFSGGGVKTGCFYGCLEVSKISIICKFHELLTHFVPPVIPS